MKLLIVYVLWLRSGNAFSIGKYMGTSVLVGWSDRPRMSNDKTSSF